MTAIRIHFNKIGSFSILGEFYWTFKEPKRWQPMQPKSKWMQRKRRHHRKQRFALELGQHRNQMGLGLALQQLLGFQLGMEW
jgi:hypothetical protein